MAIHISQTLFPQDCIELVVTDNSYGTDKIVTELNKLDYINQVYLFHQNDLEHTPQNISSFLAHITPAVGNSSWELKESLNKEVYDILFYYNEGLLAYYTFSQLVRNNRNLTVYRYEECVTSYNETYDMGESKQKKAIRLARQLLHKKILQNSISGFFCLYDRLYCGNNKVFTIPPITKDSEIIDTLKSLFPIRENCIEEKYIYFATTQDYDQKSDEEINMIHKIADIVGMDNLIIKVHPRENTDRYIKDGFKVFSRSDVPWEAVMLQLNMSDKVFITSVSGSVLSFNLMNEYGTTTYLLYPLLSYPVGNRVESIKKLWSLFPEYFSKFSVINNEEELLKINQYA